MPLQYHHMAWVRGAEKKRPLPPQVADKPEKVAMHDAVLLAAGEWDESDSKKRGVAGHVCFCIRNLQEARCIIECVDQYRNEVILFDLERKDVFVRPTWALTRFSGMDTR